MLIIHARQLDNGVVKLIKMYFNTAILITLTHNNTSINDNIRNTEYNYISILLSYFVNKIKY